jgi:electron transfer flavoprotein alpha subunit
MYAGNVLIEVESLEYLKLLTVRISNFEAITTMASIMAPIIKLDYEIENTEKIKFVEENIVNNAVDLEKAKIIVTGGRSLGTKDSLMLLL